MTCARRCLYGPIDSPSVRTAWKGRLCETCYRRLRDHLLIAVPVFQLVRAEVIPSLKATAHGDRVQTSAEHKIPLQVRQMETADDAEGIVVSWGREVFRAVPWKLDRDIPDVDTFEGTIDFFQDRFDEVVNLSFVADLHNELVPLIRELFRASGQKRMPLEDSIGTLCPICLRRDVYVDWVGLGADSHMEITCKHCRLVIDEGPKEGEIDGR